MRFLTGLSWPHAGWATAAVVLVLFLVAAVRGLADLFGLVDGGNGAACAGVALARTVLAGAVAVLRLAALVLTGATFWMLTGASAGVSDSLNFRLVLRSATFEPCVMLTACFLALRMSVFLVTTCSCAV